MAEETRRRSARRHSPTIPQVPVRGTTGDENRAAAGATRIAAVLAFATLVASGASIHALVFWAAALFLMIRFGDLEGLHRDDEGRD